MRDNKDDHYKEDYKEDDHLLLCHIKAPSMNVFCTNTFSIENDTVFMLHTFVCYTFVAVIACTQTISA